MRHPDLGGRGFQEALMISPIGGRVDVSRARSRRAFDCFSRQLSPFSLTALMVSLLLEKHIK